MKIIQVLILIVATLFAWASHAAVNIQHWQTTSGTQVYFVENHDLPMLDLSVSFPAGSARDSEPLLGIAGMTRYMMTLGAGDMNEEEITNAFADIGAQIGGDFDMDKAGFKLRTLSSERSKALTVFNKILHVPVFNPVILEREKITLTASLQEAETQPESIVSKAFKKAIYGKHAYHHEGSGEMQTINAIKVDDIRQFYHTYYTAKSAVIAMIGDITETQAREIAEQMSSGLPQGPAIKKNESVQALTQPVELRIKHPASQAHLLMGQPGIKRGDADYFPLYVGNYILGGGGFVSRLTEEVREKRGLVYSVYSYFLPMAELGPFQLGFQTKKEQVNDALSLVKQTLTTFINQGVTDAELKAAKDNIIGGFPMRIDSNKKILEYLSVIGFYQLPLSYLDDFNREVAKVTKQQIKEAFQRRVSPERLATVIVGAE